MSPTSQAAGFIYLKTKTLKRQALTRQQRKRLQLIFAQSFLSSIDPELRFKKVTTAKIYALLKDQFFFALTKQQ